MSAAGGQRALHVAAVAVSAVARRRAREQASAAALLHAHRAVGAIRLSGAGHRARAAGEHRVDQASRTARAAIRRARPSDDVSGVADTTIAAREERCRHESEESDSQDSREEPTVVHGAQSSKRRAVTRSSTLADQHFDLPCPGQQRPSVARRLQVLLVLSAALCACRSPASTPSRRPCEMQECSSGLRSAGCLGRRLLAAGGAPGPALALGLFFYSS